MDVFPDLAFVWVGLGETVETQGGNQRGPRYELGIGLWLRISRHDVVVVTTSSARAALDSNALALYGIDLGFEHAF